MLQSRPIIVPLLSPFTDDGMQLSEVRVARIIRWHLERGAGGFLIGGETGEWWSLAFTERKQLIEWTMREAREVPVYVHATCFTTAATLDLVQTASRYGATGCVLCPPPGFFLTDHEVRAMASAVRRYAELPIACFDPSGLIDLGDWPLSWKALEDESFSVTTHGGSAQLEEALVGEAVVSPLAVFGADAARKFGQNWLRWKIRCQGALRLGKGPRLAKTLMQEVEVDSGSPRAPLLPMDEQGRAILASILEDLKTA